MFLFLHFSLGGKAPADDPAGPPAAPPVDGERSFPRLEGDQARLRLHFEDAEPPSRPPAPAARPVPAAARVEAGPKPAIEGESAATPGPLRGIYDKPFLLPLWRRAYLGGYTELEYHGFQDPVLELPRGFRAHRTNLFAFADVADAVRFGSEIEFENAEPGEPIEVKVEMAFVDWILFEELVIRGGALLSPLGRVNQNHDGPVREITDRPLVSTFVIPTTLTEPGIGAHGVWRPAEKLAFSYEAYATNGFRVLDRNGQLAAPIAEREQLLRNGRPSLGGDNNRDLASTGRIGIEALGAVQLGGSWHVGTYDERSQNLLNILAGDVAVVHGPLALEGEIARAGFERNEFARTAGVPAQFWGFYVQASASHMPGPLKRLAPRIFDREGTTFTAVLRYDWVDLEGDRGEAVEPGINFRPSSDTVFKFSYRVGLKSLGVGAVPGRKGFNDDGFAFSLASYF